MLDEYFEIEGKNRLFGDITVHSAKNAVLPMMAGAILTDEPVTIQECPDITDIYAMSSILEKLGVDVKKSGRDITISGSPKLGEVPDFLACTLRSSVYMLGALLSTVGRVELAKTGGCKIGARPVDIHIDGLKTLGAKVEENDGKIICSADKLKGGEFFLKYPSVGATENLILSAVKAKGTTSLFGVAREPEILSLCDMLNKMGAKIYGAGTSVIRIDGVDRLFGATIKPIGDRIVAGTYACAVAVTGGKVTIHNADTKYLGGLLSRLVSDHYTVKDSGLSFSVESDGVNFPCDFYTGAYPMFPTDLQAPYSAVLLYANGKSEINETVFENRFSHIEEYKKFGAKVHISGQTAKIFGCKELYGATVSANDLRGGAGLIIAALGANGKSEIGGLHFIDRGYENIEKDLFSLGAKITRIYKNAENP
ncbi:MAG: UDP-N-acetylglucosamine 1-carboxyvinyltransferase [Clostridia bacterium]|nr:UDP-N-acetylglucosamine 1-carboxyvinyltransferase [Clostridia bacterium]